MLDTTITFAENKATKNTPWSKVGNDIPSGASVDETLKLAGLDWEVLKKPAYVNIDGKMEKISGNFTLLRADTMNVVSPFVGSRYKPVQNTDAFSVFHEFCEAGSMTMETAGSFFGGQHVWGLAKMDRSFSLCDGETIQGYFLLMQSHVYGSALRAMFTPVRYPGGHTIMQAVNRHAAMNRTYTMSHSRKFNAARIMEIKEVLMMAETYMADFEKAAKELSTKPVTEEQSVMYFIELFHPDLFKRIKNGYVTDVPTKIADLANWDQSNLNLRRTPNYIDEYAGADMPTCRATAWGLVQATGHAFDHAIGRSVDTRLESAWMGANAKKKLLALKRAMDM